MLTALRQLLCSHVFNVDEIKRVSEHEVRSPCMKCGKVASASYGLALPGHIHWPPRRPRTVTGAAP